MFVITVTGQEDDPSDDLEYIDLDLDNNASDDDRYLLRTTTVEQSLKREMNRHHHDYVHFDIVDPDGGIEVFCSDSLYKNNKRTANQLKSALQKIAKNKVGRTKNLKQQSRCGSDRSVTRCGPIWTNEYHLIKLFNCDIYCPKWACPN